jgi:hypothetical protein
MKVGTWIHDYDDVSLDEQIELAAENGLQTIRSYHIGYAEGVVEALKRTGMSLLAGMPVDAEAMIADWRSQVRLDELARYHELGVPLEGICVGNELREGGDAPDNKRFTARLSFGLANVISTYRQWLDEHGLSTPLTYAMEVIVNAYPMGDSAWFTFDAFEESRRFLCDSRARNDRLAHFELHLRRALGQLEGADKPLFLSETGFPSAVSYHMEGERLVVPESDNARYRQAMHQFVDLIRQVNADYDGRIQAIYFYEWRDNLHHAKILNVEQSPIHVAFGLCDRFGVPKFDIKKLTG